MPTVGTSWRRCAIRGALHHGTKFAVEGLSQALSYELTALGVRMKIVEPGSIKTDFGGRSFVFRNDESMAEYQPLVKKLFASFGPMAEQASPAAVVAEVIYTAATDGTDKLRYIAAEDARQLLAARQAQDDASFTAPCWPGSAPDRREAGRMPRPRGNGKPWRACRRTGCNPPRRLTPKSARREAA